MPEGSNHISLQHQVPRYSFGGNDRIVIQGIDYYPRSVDFAGHVLVRADSGLAESFTHAQIYELLSSKGLQRYAGWYHEKQAALRNQHGLLLLSDLPEKEQEEISWRQQWCDRFLQLERTDDTVSRTETPMLRAISRIAIDIAASKMTADGKKVRCDTKETLLSKPAPQPSPSQLRRWLRAYTDSGRQPFALRDGRHRSGNRTVRGDDDSADFRREFAQRYASQNKPSKKMVYQDYEHAIADENERREKEGLSLLTKVTLRSFSRLIDKLNPFLVHAGRHGTEAAMLKFAIERRGLDVTRPLERVEMDEWKVTLQVLLMDAGVWSKLSPEAKRAVKRARLWLSVALDCASKCCLAARLSEQAPSGASSIATLEMAVCDKTAMASASCSLTPYDMHGTPECIVTDTGAAFISAVFRSAVADLGTTALLPPVKLPFLRATAERFFGTARTMLTARFPGQSFENIVAKGKYDSEGNACLDVEELNRVLLRWIIDIYHNSPHEGLAGETPRNAWLRLNNLYGVTPPPSDEIRRHIFGITGHRRIGRDGLLVLGLRYQSADLQKYRLKVGQKPVRFRLDRFDLGEISVWVEGSWLKVPAAFEEIRGTSCWEWIAAARELRLRNADTSSLSHSIVRAALDDVRGLADMAIKRAEIDEPPMSGATFAKVEHELFRVFAFAGHDIASNEDLLGWDDTAPDVPPPEVDLITPAAGRGDWLTED